MTRRGNAVIQFHVAWEEAMRLNQHATSRRRKGRAPTMVGSKPIAENIANARKQGASTWEGATT